MIPFHVHHQIGEWAVRALAPVADSILAWDATAKVLRFTKTLSGITLTTPVISDFSQAAHDHGDADDGGAITGSHAITVTTAAQPNITSVGTLLGATFANANAINWKDSAGNTDTILQLFSDDNVYFDNPNAGKYIIFRPNGTIALLYLKENVKIGGAAERATTEGTNHIDIFNGTAPVGTLTNGASLYCEGGEMKAMDSAGNITTLT